jgi:UDP-glucuronate 4-epimerase
MYILVTGAAGFIGSHVCEALVAGGHRVTGVDSFDGYLYPAEVKRHNAAELACALPADRFDLIEGDICDQELMASLCQRRPEVVCHLAALAGVRPSIAEPLRYLRTNLHGTTVLLEAMRAAGCARMVFASSSSVYGVKAAAGADLAAVAPFREDDPAVHPASPYAASKRAGELICSTYRDLHGIGASCLRFFTVFGPRQRPDMAIHMFVRAVADGRPLVFFGDGSMRRDYTFISDVARGVVRACERIEPGAYRVYNLGGSTTTSLADLVAIVERVVGRSAVLDRRPLQPGDVPVTSADLSNAARDLGYAPAVGVEEGVGEFWRWLQTAPRPTP